LHIPSLRERRDDIRALVHENERLLRGKKLGPDAWTMLAEHDWPGNIRELLHVLTRAGIVLPGPVIGGEIGPLLQKGLDEGELLSDTAIADWRAEIATGKSFWETVWSAFIRRDLNRGQVRLFLKNVFSESEHNLKTMTQKLNVRDSEYPRFISMLHRYDIHPKKDK
jgi:DNA-binding NtrC family response regulator